MAVIDLINKTNFLPTKIPIKVPAEKVNEVISRLNTISSGNGVLEADTINEYTSGAGVTIDGVLIKDGTVTTTAPTIKSVAPAVTAHAGGTKAAAFQLTEELNVITTCATALDSVLLPSAVVGQEITVANLGVATCAIYAYGAVDTIDDIVAANPFILNPEDVVTFHCYTVDKWQSDSESDGVYDRIYVDTISENTSAAGITIDSVLLKDGSIALPKAAAHSLILTDSTTATETGGALSITGAAGATTGSGGGITIRAGASGAGGATGNGGNTYVIGGASVATNGIGGSANLTGGAGTGTQPGGLAQITTGANAGTTGGASGELILGIGGAATHTVGTGGAGGTISITGAAGGLASGAAGIGGAGSVISISSGAGGATTSATGGISGRGGEIDLTAGDGGALEATNAAVASAGGTIDLNAGHGGAATGGTGGAGGSITLNAGNSGASTATGGAAGIVSIAGGTGMLATAGGVVELTGGIGGTTAAGGAVTARGGQGGATNGNGGDANLVGGAPQGTGTGGQVAINAGDAVAQSGHAGSISIQPGDGFAGLIAVNGTNAGNATIVAGTPGTAVTGTAGTGGTIALQGSTGGAASGAAGTGGTGTIISITSGAGGATTEGSGGAETGGTAGYILVDTGDGGAIHASSIGTAGNGGQLTVSTGNGGAATAGTAGNGGELYITAGDGGAGTTAGEAGFISITGGAGGAAAAGAHGGHIIIDGGTGGATNGAGGDVVITGGTGNGTGLDGSVNIGDSTTDEVTLLADTGVHAQRLFTLDKYFWCEDFDEEVAAVTLDAGLRGDEWAAAAGTNGDAADITYIAGVGGIIQAETDGADNDSICSMRNVPSFNTDSNPVMEVRFRVSVVSGAAANGMAAFVGFTDSTFALSSDKEGGGANNFALIGIDTDNDHTFGADQIVFCTDDDGGSGAGGTYNDCGVAATADTWITARIDLTDIEQPRVWVNNAGTAINPSHEVPAANITGTLKANTVVYPVFYAQTLVDANAQNIQVDYIKIWQDR
jgi:hypothetical protein